MLGYMFQRPKQPLMFVLPHSKRISIHTFFVFGPIDIFILDDKKKVIESHKNLQPWSLWTSKHKGRYFLETPAGGESYIKQIVFA